MAKVKCRVCENLDGKMCLVKDVKVAQNKPRKCDSFDYNPSKIKVKQNIKTTYIPWHLRDKTAYKEHVQEQESQLAKQAANMNGVKIASPDCLAQFRSSAIQEDA
jgi:hypothetical protein